MLPTSRSFASASLGPIARLTMRMAASGDSPLPTASSMALRYSLMIASCKRYAASRRRAIVSASCIFPAIATRSLEDDAARSSALMRSATGMQKPIASSLAALDSTTPITWPLSLKAGPPELPGFTETPSWRKCWPSRSTSVLTTPRLMAFFKTMSPSPRPGLPMTVTSSPRWKT